MKKLLALFIALALLLAACRTQLSFSHSSGEENGFVWRTLDLDDEVNAEVKRRLETELARQDQRQRQLDYEINRTTEGFFTRRGSSWGNGVFTRGIYPRLREIVFVNPQTRQETILLSGRCTLDEPHTREQYMYCGEYCAEGPRFITHLNERYFIYQWFRGAYPVEVSPIGFGVADLHTLQTYFVELDDPWIRPTEQRGDVFFWENAVRDARGDYSPHSGTLNLFASRMEDLPHLKFTDLLADIEHQPVQGVMQTLLCENERYYIVVCRQMLSFFDLQELSVLQIPVASFGIPMPDEDYLRDHFFSYVYLHDNTLFWFSEFPLLDIPYTDIPYLNIAVEIILP